MFVFLTLLKNDFKLFFRDWKAMLLLLVTPFLFISFFAYALAPYFNRDNFIEPFTIALVDSENTAQTRMLANQLDQVEIFKEVLRTDEAEAKEMISENKIAAAVIIPPDFTASVEVGENKPVTVVGNRTMPLQSYIVKNLLQSAANIVSAGQSAINTIYDYNRKAGLSGSELDEQFKESTMRIMLEALSRNEVFSYVKSSGGFNLTPMEYYTAALIVVFLMFAGMPAMKLLVAERSCGLTGRLCASPARLWQMVLSKFFVSAILSVAQFAVIVILTSVISKNYWGAPLRSILLLFAGIIFAVSAWSVFVSAISKTSATADVIGNLSILLMAVLGGSIYPLTSMPELIRGLSKMTINRWAMDGFMVIFSGNPALGTAEYVYPLLLIGFVLLVLSAVAMKLDRRRV